MDRAELLKTFSAFYEAYKDKEIVFCGHRHADIDALVSAYVLASFFPKGKVAVSDDMNISATLLAELFSIDVYRADDISKGVPFVAVDTSHVVLLPQAKERNIVAVFDHHQQTKDNFRGQFNFIDSNAKATAELVGIIAEEKGVDEKRAALLAVAIISDTMRFIDANERTLDVFNSMYKKSGYSYRKLVALAFPPKPLSDKVGTLEGLATTKYEVYGDTTIAYAKASMHEGEIATYLAQAGDIGFVAVEDKKLKATRVSARANMHADVPLNKIMKEVGKHFGGDGGGHIKASGCVAYADRDEVLAYTLEVTKRYLSGVEGDM